MNDRIPDTDSDDREQERLDKYADEPTNYDRVRDHFAQMDRRDRTGPCH